MKKLTINGITPISVSKSYSPIAEKILIATAKQKNVGFDLARIAQKGGYFVKESATSSFRCLRPYIQKVKNGFVKSQTPRSHNFRLKNEMLWVENDKSVQYWYTFESAELALKFYEGLLANNKSL